MKKDRIAPVERVIGVFLGIVLALTFFLIGIVNVLGSQSFYLGQDKRYVITYRMNLRNADHFRDVYHSLQAAFAGQDSFNYTVYRDVPEESAPGETLPTSRWAVTAKGESLWDEGEEAFLRTVGQYFRTAKWTFAALYLPILLLVAWRIKKRGRVALMGVGWYSVIASVVVAALLNIALAAVATQTDLLAPLSGGLWLRVVFSKATQADLLTGTQWFFDFLMLVPIGIGTILVKASVKKDNDPGEDYLYQ